jgi:hypothetical protein
MYGRHGFYVRETNICVIFIVVRANDLHQGNVVAYDFATKKKWEIDTALKTAWRLAGPVNRLVFVQYFANAACLRTASMSISRPAHFGNQGAMKPHKMEQKNYCDDGRHIMGDEESRANRLGREFAFQFFNLLQGAELTLNCTMAELLALISFDDKDGQSKCLKPPDFDIILHSDYVQKWRGWYAWHRQQSAKHYIRITKEERSSVQSWLKLNNAKSTSFPMTERRPVVSRFLQNFSSAPEKIVERAIERRQMAGKVCDSRDIYVNNVSLIVNT